MIQKRLSAEHVQEVKNIIEFKPKAIIQNYSKTYKQ